MLKKIIGIGVLLIMGMGMGLFSACTPKDKGISDGFYGMETDPGVSVPYYFTAYKSDKTIFDLDKDEITLVFFYGISAGASGLGYIQNAENWEHYKDVKIRLYFFSNEFYPDSHGHEQYFIKEIEDFYNGQYDCGYTNKKFVFDHSESIAIPNELFVGEQGSISFSLAEYYTPENEEHGVWRGIGIYYKVKDNKVTLQTYSQYITEN